MVMSSRVARRDARNCVDKFRIFYRNSAVGGRYPTHQFTFKRTQVPETNVHSEL